MKINFRARRIATLIFSLIALAFLLFANPKNYEQIGDVDDQSVEPLGVVSENVDVDDSKLAIRVLAELEIKGRAPKTNYKRSEFYSTWPNVDGCSLRQIIIRREVGEQASMNGCDVVGGEFIEAYTGKQISFHQKSEFSNHIQIDHIVALSDAWQKGAQYMSREQRYAIATDPLNLIAVDSSANQQKSDSDAATWLPPNKSFRCQYIARQISVKKKYNLWVTQAEHDAMETILQSCPREMTVGL